MLMSYHKLPSWTHYWNTDPDFNVPLVSTIMTRDRFGQILANLHLNNNAAIPDANNDKLHPLIDMMNSKNIKLYNVSLKLSVGESMILFKGPHSIKQYNPMKLIKRGYKMWVRADMDGYISRFDVYQGKATNAYETFTPGDNEGNKFGLGEQVVHTMVFDLLKNHEVYFNSFFTSVPLMKYLKENGVNAAGTVRLNCKPFLLIWKKILIEVSVTIVYQKMVLQFSSGKTTSLFLSCQTFMGQIFHL